MIWVCSICVGCLNEILHIISLFSRIADEFVAMFRDRTGYPIVEPAHMVRLVFHITSFK